MRFQLHSHVANFKALGFWNNLDEACTTTHSHFKFSDSLFIQAVEPCLILEPLRSPQMRTSVQNMSQHYPGDSQEYVKQRETTSTQNTALANAQIPALHTSCLHSHFCHQNHRLCDGKNAGLLRRTERIIRTIPCSLEALQLHTKKVSQPLQVPVFSSVASVNLTILVFRNPHSLFTSARFHFPCKSWVTGGIEIHRLFLRQTPWQ